MRTLPREPWRGGQICGEQLEYGVVPGRSVYCSEFKKLGSPLCEEHDREYRFDNAGVLPRFAEGNALGLVIKKSRWGWSVLDEWGQLCSSADDRAKVERLYGFTLLWEPYEGNVPIDATPEELAAFQVQLKEASA